MRLRDKAEIDQAFFRRIVRQATPASPKRTTAAVYRNPQR